MLYMHFIRLERVFALVGVKLEWGCEQILKMANSFWLDVV